MCKFKRPLSIILSVLLILSSVPLTTLTALASTTYYTSEDGYLTYTVENGEATITDCDTSISGDYTIPITLGGYPVTSIGSGTFSDCTSLTNITIPDSVTDIGGLAFEGCTSLKSITIPDSVTSPIQFFTFAGCTSLVSVTIGDGVTAIFGGAFYGCASLVSVIIGNSVTSINDFFMFSYGTFADCTSLKSITIPNSVTSIGRFAFDGCTSLKSVTIGSGTTSIDETAFYNCTSIASITVDEDNEYYSSDNYGVLFNKNKTELIQFPAGSSLTSYSIFNSVTSIVSYAFRDCTSLASVTIGNGVTSIGSEAFYNCTSLASVTIGNSVTSIGNKAFCNCTSLASITIPDSVTTIGKQAFGYYSFRDISGYKLIDGFTIRGNYGTAAETYAEENGIKFKLASDTTIDFSNGDLSITINSNIPFIGGTEFSLDIFPELPVFVKKDEDSVSVGINIKLIDDSTNPNYDDDDDSKWQKRKSEIKQTITDLKKLSGYTIDSTLKNKINKFMASKGKANFSALGKFEITFVGYLEGKRNASGLTEASGDIYLLINYSLGTTWQTVVVAVPVVINLNVSTKGKVTAEATYDLENNTLKGDVTATLTPKVEAAGGVGVSKIVGVQAYGSAKVPIEYQLIGGNTTPGINSVNLTGELGVKAYFAWFKFSKSFASNTWNIYTRTTTVYSARLASVIEDGDTNTDVYDTDNYTVSDLSYLEDQSQWLGEKKLLRSSASTANEFKSLLTNTYRNTEPVIATDGENTVMAWIGADTARTDYNAPCVYYSVYDSTADSWSSPQTVDTDSTLDSTPYLYGADGEIYLIYADSLTEFDENSDVSDFTSNQSIAVSKFNAKDGTFSEPVRIDSSEGSYVSVPQITVVNGNAVAVWQECDTDDVFGLCDTNKIMYSVLSGDTWSTPAAIAENLTSVVGLDAGSLDGTNILISYITDGDNDLSTTDDRTLYTVDTEGSTVETAAGTVSGVQFAVMPDTDAMSVIWYDSGNIGVLDSSSEVRYLYEESVGVSDEFTVLSDRIIYTGASDGSSNIYALIYNGSSWNSPIALTEQDEYVTSLSAAEADGKVIAATAVKNITITEEEVEDKCDLCYIILADETSVSIDSVYVEQNDVLPGGKTAVNIDVSNKGGTVIDELTFILKDSSGNEVDSVSVTDLAINPGETQTVETSVTIPDTLSSAEEFTFEIECSGDNDASDNEFSITMGYSDLSVYAEKIRIGNRWFVAATVTNESNIPAGGTLEIYTPADDTEAAKTVEIETLENGDSKFVQFEITEEVLGGTSGSVTVTAVSDKDEYFDYNNSEQLYYDLEYDILPESVSLSSTEITVKEGGSKALTAAVLPENCADPSVIYASADPAIAAVDEDGSITGVSVGTTTVTVMTVQGGFTAECAVTVEHDYVETSIIEPTCEAAGYTVYTCSVCGDTYTDSETAALGHNYTSVITAATCTEDGNIVYTCSACGDTYTETISASGHSYGEWVVTVEPDYEIEGEQQRTCTVCGNAETETIAPLDDTAADDPTVSCTHFCHSTNSLVQLFYKIIRFLWKIFGINQYCECGEAHW